MSLATWNPMREIDLLHHELDRLFDRRSDERWPFSRISFLPGRSARSYPLLNVAEDADAYTVEALAPGIDPTSLKVSVQNKNLVIEGEKKPADESVEAEHYHRNERSTGKFVRTLTLPIEVDPDKVAADYRNGLLRVTLPKTAASRPRQIAVNVG